MLAAVFADHVQCATAAGTVLGLDIDDELVARQVRRQGTAIAMGGHSAPPSHRWRRGICRRPSFGGTLFRIHQDELQLIEVELLRTWPIAMAQPTLDQQPQLVVLGIRLRHHLPQHLLQDIRLVGECREINLHLGIMMYVVASLPMTPS